MPKLPAPVAEMVPELVTLAVVASIALPVAEMVPEFVTLAVPALIALLSVPFADWRYR